MEIDHRQLLLLAPDLREWVFPDDLAPFVIETVWGMELGAFRFSGRGRGSPGCPPHMMLALLIYCHTQVILFSRRIERATYRGVSVRYSTRDTHQDHDTIRKFRRKNLAAVSECFARLLHLARKLGLLKVGTVSVDGTKIKSNANKNLGRRHCIDPSKSGPARHGACRQRLSERRARQEACG